MQQKVLIEMTALEFKSFLKICIQEEVEKVMISPNPKKLDEYLTVKDLEKMLQVSKVTVLEWNKKGIIKGHRVGKKRLYFRKDEVEKALSNYQGNYGQKKYIDKVKSSLDTRSW
jgi:excisionase family DNA binding protein